MILDMQPIKNFYSISCYATHMLISSFNPKKMELLLLFFQVFCLDSKDIMNLDKGKVYCDIFITSFARKTKLF
jgi:hypothetical protein